MKITAIIVAAGSGTRMKAGKNKVFLELAGKSVLENTIEVFENCDLINDITVVTGDVAECEALLAHFSKVKKIVIGGSTRQESVKCGLLASDCDIAVIHDGARALVRGEEIASAISAAKEFGAAAVGVKCKDTLKRADKDGFIEATLDREFVYNIQTPQVFDFKAIKKMHTEAKTNTFTDDCALAESFGVKIKIVDGSYDNIKITTPEDMEIAEKIIEKRRTES